MAERSLTSSYERIIQAPMEKVFLTVADLARWPEFLPHYRYNRFIQANCFRGVGSDVVLSIGVSPEVGFRV